MCASPSRHARNPSSWSNARVEGGVASEARTRPGQDPGGIGSGREGAKLRRAQEQTENLINFLLGKQPGPVARGKSLIDQPQPPQVPAGLPSRSLERRPDLRVAEQQLIAANARVGVAKAAFFPVINLTACGGYQTTDLLGVVSRTGTAYWVGRRRGPADLRRGPTRGELQDGEGAARRSSDQLSEGDQWSLPRCFRRAGRLPEIEGVRVSQEHFTRRCATKAGSPTCATSAASRSYLEVLDTERQRLTAEQQLAQAQRDVLTALVRLYKSLGGGWQ